MIFTTITILTAALATIYSAVPTASAVVTQSLPANFTLEWVSYGSSSLTIDTFPKQIFVDKNYGERLYIATPGTVGLGSLGPVPFVGNGTSAYVHHPDFTMNFDWYLNVPGVIGNEFVVSLVAPTMMREDRVMDGFRQINGTLAVGQKDGKGLQSLWQACLEPTYNYWTVYWGTDINNLGWGVIDVTCIKIDLIVVSR